MRGKVLLIVVTEGVVAVGLTFVACATWRSRKTRPLGRSLIPFLGIAWASRFMEWCSGMTAVPTRACC